MAKKLEHRGVMANDDGDGPFRDPLPNFSDMFPSNFPEGLRMLVFDEDSSHLQMLETNLQKFQYQVTICNEENKAMYALRNHRNRFDIAIIQGNNSDGDMFRFLSEIGSEMDLPIIIISEDKSVQSVMKWMINGATDYLIKPIKPEELRIIFKHLVKKVRERRSVVTGEAEEKAGGEKSSSVGDSTIRNPNKRKRSMCLDAEVNEEDRHDHNDRACAASSKKRRVVWTKELHKKFVDAVEYLGLDKAVPKKILELMNVENLSRENVASHLQVTFLLVYYYT
ncbi:unnamed protein product [Arabidopsis lyrata]|uniref:Response regulatory domain-containing protein n=1 Tax=Arabidopsis lyrata subsp. lyrata TaxID=81972 RepID=D7MNQ4_ARALL|nr:hypothetical protein ARALYDRAFT_357174 [Arabidopsis lyrata subsp. lyrata]CAH8279000.1 unnamed protein product [Arabidopsis lyrata]